MSSLTGTVLGFVKSRSGRDLLSVQGSDGQTYSVYKGEGCVPGQQVTITKHPEKGYWLVDDGSYTPNNASGATSSTSSKSTGGRYNKPTYTVAQAAVTLGACVRAYAQYVLPEVLEVSKATQIPLTGQEILTSIHSLFIQCSEEGVTPNLLYTRQPVSVSAQQFQQSANRVEAATPPPAPPAAAPAPVAPVAPVAPPAAAPQPQYQQPPAQPPVNYGNLPSF
jgi:hypothetical protein